jgi:hypothetical protein
VYPLSHRHVAPASARIKPALGRASRPAGGAAGLLVLLTLFTGTLAAILLWRTIALAGNPIQLFEVFDTAVVGGSILVLIFNFRLVVRRDWIVAASLGSILGLLVPFTGFYALFEWATGAARGSTLPEPAWAVVTLAHGGAIFVVTLAGLCIMRRGGPIMAGVWCARRPATSYSQCLC